MDEKFKIELKKKLDAFKSAKEWSDFISLLSSLDRTLNSYKFDKINDLDLLVKRLTQCLSPALPAGVHTKCLETYQVVMNKFTKETFLEEFNSITFNFFSSASNLKTMALGNYFNILTNKIIPLGKEVEKYTENILIGLLPFLEIEGNEYFSETLALIEKFRESVDLGVFYEALWDIFTTNSYLRISVINYLFKSTHNNCDLDKRKNFTLAICLSLQDKQINVLRGSLDILTTYFPLKTITDQNELIKIISATLKLFLLRDLSINKRILSWIDLKNENNFELIYKSMKSILQEELGLFFRILIILMDNELIFNYLVDRLVLKSLFYLKSGEKPREINEFYFQKEEKSDQMKYAEIFFENLDKNIFWKSVDKNLSIVLEENFSQGLKGGKNDDINIVSDKEIDEVDKKIEQINKELKEQDLIEEELDRREEEELKDLEEKMSFKLKNETDNNEPSDNKEIKEENLPQENLSMKTENNIEEEKFFNDIEENKDEYILEEIKSEENVGQEHVIDNKLEEKDETDFYNKDEEKDQEFFKEEHVNLNQNELIEQNNNSDESDENIKKIFKINESRHGKTLSEDFSEELHKQTFIARTTDEFLELLVFIFDKFNLVNEEVKEKYVPNLLIKVTENYHKFEENNLFIFYDTYKMNINSPDLSILFRKLIDLEDFLLFCAILEIFIKYFGFMNEFESKFWKIFYKKFIKLSAEKKVKLVSLISLILSDEKQKQNILEVFDTKVFFNDFISQIDENTVKCFYNYNFVFENQLEVLLLNYISDLNDIVVDRVNLFFYYLYNYLDILDDSFYEVLVCLSYKLENITTFNTKSVNEENNLKVTEKKEAKNLEIKTKIVELFYNIYNNKLITNLILTELEKHRKNNRIKNGRKVLGSLNTLKCFIKYSSSFKTYLSKENNISSVTSNLLGILITLAVNYDLELKEVNFDISFLSLDLINLLYNDGIIARKEIINFDLSKIFEFVVKTDNPFLLNKITTLLEISVNGFKKSDYTSLDVINSNLTNIDILLNVIFKMENKISQFVLFNKIVHLKEKENIYLIYKTVKFIIENNQFYNRDDIETLVNSLLNNINITILSVKRDSLMNEDEKNTKFTFFFYYSNKILTLIVNKFPKLLVDSVLNTNLMIHKFQNKAKIYELILKRVLGDIKSLSYLYELNKFLTKEELRMIILENKTTIEEIWILNKKVIDFFHYRFIIELYLKAKREKDELISKVFNNLLIHIQKLIGYRNKEILKIYDVIVKGYKKINYNSVLFYPNLFALLGDKELRDINLEIIYDLSDKISFKYIWDYFLSNDFFIGRIDLKHKILKKYVKNESIRFGELLTKIDQGFYLTRESELQNKHYALKRAAFFMLAGEVNQFMSYFPKILEKLIELINIDPSIRKIFFLLLRILASKNNHSKLNNLWPSLFYEIFKFIDLNSFEIFKFLDVLFLINSGETKEFQSKFFIKKSYKKVYYEGRGLETFETERIEENSIFNKLKERNSLKEKKEFIPIPPKRKLFLPSKKNLNENDIKEYLTYVSYYYKHLDEYAVEIDEENFFEGILIDFEEE